MLTMWCLSGHNSGMSLADLYHGHYADLVRSFGVANAEGAYKDSRLARAFGDGV
jgi:hypothetical protein